MTDLHEDILQEFVERQAETPWRAEGLSVLRGKAARAALGVEDAAHRMREWRAENPEANREAERRTREAIKADPERLARRREVARLSAQRRRRLA